jgi:hypothetical protein
MIKYRIVKNKYDYFKVQVKHYFFWRDETPGVILESEKQAIAFMNRCIDIDKRQSKHNIVVKQGRV